MDFIKFRISNIVFTCIIRIVLFEMNSNKLGYYVTRYLFGTSWEKIKLSHRKKWRQYVEITRGKLMVTS